jgi:hypothetical protein
MTRVVRLMREADLDASPAEAIEALRLAETLTALRGRTSPTLEEVVEAIRASICFGSDMPLALVRRKLIIGEELGELPPEAPLVSRSLLSRRASGATPWPRRPPRGPWIALRRPQTFARWPSSLT